VRVVLAAAEVAPLARTGGLGEVIGALARALAQQGVEVAVVMPGHRCALQAAPFIEHTGWKVSVPVSSRQEEGEVLRTEIARAVPVYLIAASRYYDRPELYGEGGVPYSDNAERFVFFSRAVLALTAFLGTPHVLHAHDWHAALVPAFLRADAARYPAAQTARTVLTIHNLAYQGDFWAEDWHLLNLDRRWFTFSALEAWGRINFLKGGISFADAITTVSPSYAREVQTPQYGCGLDGALRYRSRDLVGILNGIDTEVWDPARDPFLPAHYDAVARAGKALCKRALEKELGLRESAEGPLAGVISRLVEQKGTDLIIEEIPELVAMGLRLAILGRGEARFEEALRHRAAEFPGHVSVRIAFDEALAHRIEAGADMFFMPSRFEPCGLNQMYSLRYGTLPVVHRTGGLADTVIDADSDPAHGTGFTFEPCTRAAFLDAVRRACRCFSDRSRWESIVGRAMQQDFSWQRSAAEYRRLYESLLAKSRAGAGS